MCFTVKAINLQGYYVISYETTLVIDDGGLWHPPNYDGFATLNASAKSYQVFEALNFKFKNFCAIKVFIIYRKLFLDFQLHKLRSS